MKHAATALSSFSYNPVTHTFLQAIYKMYDIQGATPGCCSSYQQIAANSGATGEPQRLKFAYASPDPCFERWICQMKGLTQLENSRFATRKEGEQPRPKFLVQNTPL